MDRNRLIKVLALTTSSNDGEALNAIRKANEIIKGEGLTWEQVLQQVTVRETNITVHRHGMAGAARQEPSWVPPHLQDPIIIELMFRAVFAMPRSDNEEFWQFLESIHNRWRTHKNLTEKQYDALRRSYLRAKKTASA